MKKITRRSFLKTTAKAAAITVAAPVVLPEGWYSLAQGEKPGYFEREFEISDSLCQKVLAE
ncbi:MAG: twin-arginine translocation signal domain-containing protein, partial [Candidatus Aminicenantes bacterium]|nr:twin-arginine translocation signal domain-containing protein [Candidatus Aminicenantes bacterium]